MSQYTETILAGESFDFGGGNRFQIIESDNKVKVEVFSGSQLIESAESVNDSYYQEPELKANGFAFDYVRVTATVDTVISVEISKGKGGSNAIGGSVGVSGEISVAPNGTLSDAVDVSCIASNRTLISAADVNRKAISITNLDSVSVLRIGGVTCAVNRGTPLIAGQSGTFETTGAVYAWNDTASAVLVAVSMVAK